MPFAPRRCAALAVSLALATAAAAPASVSAHGTLSLRSARTLAGQIGKKVLKAYHADSYHVRTCHRDSATAARCTVDFKGYDSGKKSCSWKLGMHLSKNGSIYSRYLSDTC